METALQLELDAEKESISSRLYVNMCGYLMRSHNRQREQNSFYRVVVLVPTFTPCDNSHNELRLVPRTFVARLEQAVAERHLEGIRAEGTVPLHVDLVEGLQRSYPVYDTDVMRYEEERVDDDEPLPHVEVVLKYVTCTAIVKAS